MRRVLYVDPPAFCATVERLVAPALRDRPLAVAPPGADRATILALSPEARAAGIERGMAVRAARKRCPDLVLVPPNPTLYARASRALHRILRVWAPLIEPRGYGHAFLDLSGTERLFGAATDVAERIRREAWTRLRLPLTVGVAGSKLVSEAATRVGRAVTNGYSAAAADRLWPLTVPAGDERGFLAPRTVPMLPEVPDPVRRRLEEYQLDLIGQIAAIAEPDLFAVFGGAGRTLRARAQGIDPRPVLPPAVRAEYRLGLTLATDTNDVVALHEVLRRLTERLGIRLRRRGLSAQRLAVGVDYSDYRRDARRIPLAEAALDAELWHASRRALGLALSSRVAVRRIEVTLEGLVESNLQLELWESAEAVRREEDGNRLEPAQADQRGRALQRALDRISERWGARAVGPAPRLPAGRTDGGPPAPPPAPRRRTPPRWPATAPGSR